MYKQICCCDFFAERSKKNFVWNFWLTFNIGLVQYFQQLKMTRCGRKMTNVLKGKFRYFFSLVRIILILRTVFVENIPLFCVMLFFNQKCQILISLVRVLSDFFSKKCQILTLNTVFGRFFAKNVFLPKAFQI